MNLYLISRPEDMGHDWDEYICGVVAASTEGDARQIHPSINEYDGGWIPASDVVVRLLGTAAPGTKAGPICESYQAG